MKLLLDTHVLLGWLSDHTSLTTKVASAIKEGKNSIFVSAVTAWEISIKRALGKLKAPDGLEEALESNRFQQLPISIGMDSLSETCLFTRMIPLIACSLRKPKLNN